MNLTCGDYRIERTFKGLKPLIFVGDRLLVFNKGTLFLMDMSDYFLEKVVKMPRPLWHKLFNRVRLSTRLFRLEPRGAAVLGGCVYLGYHGNLYRLDIKKKLLKEVHRFRDRMRSPLTITTIENIAGFDDMICYGEYFSNPSMEPVRIIGNKSGTGRWSELYRFGKGKINHIHSIVPDPINSRVWVLTGDTDDASGIWYTDNNFRTVNKLVGGQQKYRSCVLHPYEGGFVYATDTPLQDNYIFYVSIPGVDQEKLKEMNGSCIYSAVVGENIIFATTVEGSTSDDSRFRKWTYRTKGLGIKTWHSELVIGNVNDGFRTIAAFEKDCFPTALFEFGTLIFPAGKNETDQIIFYGNSVRKVDGQLIIMSQIGCE